MSKFCENCGSELVEGNKFCSSCGADVSNQSSSNVNNVINSSEKEKVRKLITQLSQKNQTNAIIWGALGVVQIIIAMCTITYHVASKTYLLFHYLLFYNLLIFQIHFLFQYPLFPKILLKPFYFHHI